jgi:nucleotide-binding universal stress UspA family protein
MRPEGGIAMGFRTILVPIEEHDFMNSTLETALLLARKFDSYIEGFALRVAIPAAYAVADVGAVAIPQLEQDIAENAQRSQSRFENFMQEHGVPRRGAATALSNSWLEDAPGGDRFVGSHGRLFDVIVLGRPGRDPKGPRMSTLEAALFESGRPVLIAPPSPRPDIGTNVMIAWNCSTEQARTIAFRDANSQAGQPCHRIDGRRRSSSTRTNGSTIMPLFATEQGPRKTTNRWSRWPPHGRGGSGTCESSRLRQFIFGGTTRYILSNAGLPVFMAH